MPGTFLENPLIDISYKRIFLSYKLCNFADAHVDLGNFVPGSAVDGSNLRKFKDLLEQADGILGIFSVDTIFLDGGKQRVGGAYSV